jgi:hypothetical protein
MNILAIAVLPFIATRGDIPSYRGQIMNVVGRKDTNSSVVARAASAHERALFESARSLELLKPFGI